jgi:CBS domain-containing protein
MEPSQSNPPKDAKDGTKPVKEIVEPTTTLEARGSVKSALDKLQAQAVEAAPVTDPDGKLVGKASKDQMNRKVGGLGHDPVTTPVERAVEKEGAPYCFEDQTIAEAEKVMSDANVDEVSVVSEEKKLLGKATRGAIEEEKKEGRES